MEGVSQDRIANADAISSNKSFPVKHNRVDLTSTTDVFIFNHINNKGRCTPDMKDRQFRYSQTPEGFKEWLIDVIKMSNVKTVSYGEAKKMPKIVAYTSPTPPVAAASKTAAPVAAASKTAAPVAVANKTAAPVAAANKTAAPVAAASKTAAPVAAANKTAAPVAAASKTAAPVVTIKPSTAQSKMTIYRVAQNETSSISSTSTVIEESKTVKIVPRRISKIPRI
jgi:hypothetical protein